MRLFLIHILLIALAASFRPYHKVRITSETNRRNIFTTLDVGTRNKPSTTANTKVGKQQQSADNSRNSNPSNQNKNSRFQAIEIYRNYQPKNDLFEMYNSTTLRLLLKISDEITANIANLEIYLTRIQRVIAAKIDRDIKFTERFGEYVTRSTSRGVGQVANTVEVLGRPMMNVPGVIMTLANETTLSLVRAGVNPFELVNTDRRRMIGNFEATNTKKRIQKLKKEKQAIIPSALPVISIYNDLKTLPNKLVYDYDRRVARRSSVGLDLYGTQSSSRFLPQSAQSKERSYELLQKNFMEMRASHLSDVGPGSSTERDEDFYETDQEVAVASNGVESNGHSLKDNEFDTKGSKGLEEQLEDYPTRVAELKSAAHEINSMLSGPLKELALSVIDGSFGTLLSRMIEYCDEYFLCWDSKYKELLKLKESLKTSSLFDDSTDDFNGAISPMKAYVEIVERELLLFKLNSELLVQGIEACEIIQFSLQKQLDDIAKEIETKVAEMPNNPQTSDNEFTSAERLCQQQKLVSSVINDYKSMFLSVDLDDLLALKTALDLLISPYNPVTIAECTSAHSNDHTPPPVETSSAMKIIELKQALIAKIVENYKILTERISHMSKKYAIQDFDAQSDGAAEIKGDAVYVSSSIEEGSHSQTRKVSLKVDEIDEVALTDSAPTTISSESATVIQTPSAPIRPTFDPDSTYPISVETLTVLKQIFSYENVTFVLNNQFLDITDILKRFEKQYNEEIYRSNVNVSSSSANFSEKYPSSKQITIDSSDVTFSDGREKQMTQFLLTAADVSLFLFESALKAILPILFGKAGLIYFRIVCNLKLDEPTVDQLVNRWKLIAKSLHAIYYTSLFYQPQAVNAPKLTTGKSMHISGDKQSKKAVDNFSIDQRDDLFEILEYKRKCMNEIQTWKGVIDANKSRSSALQK